MTHVREYEFKKIWQRENFCQGENLRLSVVIPLYNTELYIIDTLNSINAEKRIEIEYIIIDDGSTDNSMNIAMDWLSSNSVSGKLLSISNSGPSVARNIGISQCSCAYIGFFDSDDLCNASTYAAMLKSAHAYGADVVMARANSFDAKSLRIDEFPDCDIWNSLLDGSTFTITNVQRQPRLMRLEPSPVVRIYKSDFLSDEIRFPEGIFFEDLPFHVSVILSARSVILIDKTLLYYRTGRSGQTTSITGKRRFDFIESLRLSIEKMNGHHVQSDAKMYIFGLFARMATWCGEYCHYDDREEFFRGITDFIDDDGATSLLSYANSISDGRDASACRALAARDIPKLRMIAEGEYYGQTPPHRKPIIARTLSRWGRSLKKRYVRFRIYLLTK